MYVVPVVLQTTSGSKINRTGFVKSNKNSPFLSSSGSSNDGHGHIGGVGNREVHVGPGEVSAKVIGWDYVL